jgi:N-acetylmuramoyl-L-alanine amidase
LEGRIAIMAGKRILVQAGHVAPREPGFESATGTVREQELTRALRERLVKLLNVDGRFDPIPAPGDIPNGIRVDAGIFLHGDGVSNPAASGYHFGFPPGFEVNAKLARLIGREFDKIAGHPPHRQDNATADAREYYGFSRTVTEGPEVLVEHGFLTNPTEQRWIFSHLHALANAEYRALCEFYGLSPRGEVKKARIGWIVEWTDAEGVKHRKRTFSPRRLFARLLARGINRIRFRKDVPAQDS